MCRDRLCIRNDFLQPRLCSLLKTNPFLDVSFTAKGFFGQSDQEHPSAQIIEPGSGTGILVDLDRAQQTCKDAKSVHYILIQYMLYSLSQDRICNMVFPILAFIPWSCDRFLKHSTSFPSPDSESSGVLFPLAFCIVCKSRLVNLTTDRKDILRSIKKS